MKVAIRIGLLVLLGLAAGSNAARAAQVAVSTGDIQRLHDMVYTAESEVARARNTNPDLAARLQSELDDIRDEVTYLKVKLRKERSVARSEYSDVRDRLDDLRSRARGEAPASGTRGGVTGGVTGGTSGGVGGGVSTTGRAERGGTRADDPYEVPVGTEIDVRLQTALNSGTAQVEDRFEATTLVDLSRGGRVLIPAGSVLRGVVSSVDKATRTDRKGSLTVAFDQITVNGRSYPIRATVTQALESEGIRGEAGRIGTGAGVGAIIGGILGGFKGALAGILIGAGGTIAATEGTDVDLPVGTILRARFDSPLRVR